MSVRRTLSAALATLTAAGLLTACGTGDAATDEVKPKGQRGTGINIGPDQHRIRGKKDEAIAAKVPGAIRERGTLRLGASEENVRAGREPVDIKYFQKDTDYYLALQSGRIDACLGPSPSANYHVASAGRSEIVGTLSGAGDGLQGKIAATTKKGSGLVGAYAAAIDHIVRNGSYARVLKRWGLADEAVTESEINPPGLPESGS
ncbi:hypothetical protein ACFU98_03390 [Streptomyces sp. NPDC057575]|uniref:hypothetical protein n=1 Tax=unclassified Streptomyces TaxID=2593676 RepID=UPI003695D15F